MKIAELLLDEFPEFKKGIELSELYRIYFMGKPEGITLVRSYSEKAYEEIKRNHNAFFNLNGVFVFEKKTKKHVPIKLTYFRN